MRRTLVPHSTQRIKAALLIISAALIALCLFLLAIIHPGYADQDDARLRERIIQDMPATGNPVTPDIERIRLLRHWAAIHTDWSNEAGLIDDPRLDNPRGLRYALHLTSASEIFRAFDEDEGGVWCSGAAYGLMRLYERFGYDAVTIHFGVEDTSLTHTVAVVEVECDGRSIWSLQDPTYDLSYQRDDDPCLDYFDLLTLLKEKNPDRLSAVRGSEPLLRDVLYVHPNGSVEKTRTGFSWHDFTSKHHAEIAQLLRAHGYPADSRYLYLFVYHPRVDSINRLPREKRDAFKKRLSNLTFLP